MDVELLCQEIHALLIESGETVSTAESCTGGNIAGRLTSLSGSSAYFMGGIVVYTNESKVKFLGVNPETIEAHTVYSEEVVKEMVPGCCKCFGTTYAVAVSGVAGPTGGTPEIPVGTIWLAVGTATEIVTYKCTEDEGRSRNIQHAVCVALEILRDFIKNRQHIEIETN